MSKSVNFNQTNQLNSSNQLDIENDLSLILTATIDIKGMPRTTPTVPEQRQEDYYKSLHYYINNHPLVRKIIFIENSGWDLSRVQEATQQNPYCKQIEFISLNCNDFPRQYGKGFGECLLIEQGLKQSTLFKDSNYIAKITGRIYLKNMTEILGSIKHPFDCFCDYKDQGYILKRLAGTKTAGPHCDTRFIIFSKDFYSKYIEQLHIKHQQEKSHGFCIEAEFYQAIKKTESFSKVISRFPVEPKFSGIAGHFGGKDYDSNVEQTKYLIRSFSRKIMPFLHF